MTIYSNMQICGDAKIKVETANGTTWVKITDGPLVRITMEAKHVRQLEQALNAFQDAEWKADHPEAAQ